MSQIRIVLFAAVALALAACEAKKEPAPPPPPVAAEKPGGMVEDVVEVTATVEAVDHKSRHLTVKGPRGRVVSVKVPDTVKNFDQIKRGDKIVLELMEAVAVYVDKAQGSPEAETVGAVELAPKGAKPGMAAVETTRLTATVESVDLANRTVVLRVPEGNTVELPVHADVKRLDEIQKGDQIVVEFTEAMAIEVQKP
jgi:hypothetical protein